MTAHAAWSNVTPPDNCAQSQLQRRQLSLRNTRLQQAELVHPDSNAYASIISKSSASKPPPTHQHVRKQTPWMDHPPPPI
jgi:hypothetical protein